MTPGLWLMAGAVGGLSLAAIYSAISSICTNASVTSEGLVLRTILGKTIRVPWAVIRAPVQIFQAPFARLAIAVNAPFFSARFGYLVRLASLEDPEALVGALNAHVAIAPVRTAPDTFAGRPEMKKVLAVLFALLLLVILTLLVVSWRVGQ